MSKKGSNNPKEKTIKKSIFGRRRLLIPLILVIAILAGFTAWWLLSGEKSDKQSLSQEELEFQALIDDSSVAQSAEDLNEAAIQKESDLQEAESDQERARIYLELAEIYYEKGDFDKFYKVIDKAIENAELINDSEQSKEAKELKERANKEYELIKDFL